MNIDQNETLIISKQDFEIICKDFYKLGYWDSDEINNATSQGDLELDEEFNILFDDNKNRVFDYFVPTPDEPYHIIPKKLLDEILTQATLKRNKWEFPNEMWIEANSSIDVVEYIIENSKLI